MPCIAGIGYGFPMTLTKIKQRLNDEKKSAFCIFMKAANTWEMPFTKSKMVCTNLFSTKERPFDKETYSFKEEWTEKHAFILPKRRTKLMGWVVKSSATTRPGMQISVNCSQNREGKTTKIKHLISSYQARSRIMVTTMTQHEEAIEASLRMEWVLGKPMKAFSDVEIMKREYEWCDRCHTWWKIKRWNGRENKSNSLFRFQQQQEELKYWRKTTY